MLYMSAVITLNTFRAYVHITIVKVIFIHIYVVMILRQTIVKQSEVELFTLMEVKTQEQALKLYSACVVIISIQRNEQNTTFKH